MGPDGDYAGFEAWYRATHPRLLASLTLLVGDLDAAGEATDEAPTPWRLAMPDIEELVERLLARPLAAPMPLAELVRRARACRRRRQVTRWAGSGLALAVVAVVVAAGLGVLGGRGPVRTEQVVTGPAPAAGAAVAPAPYVVAVSTSGTVEVLSAANGTVVRVLHRPGARTIEHPPEVPQIAYSPKGRRVFEATLDGRSCPHNIDSIPLAGGAPSSAGAGSSPALSPDGSERAYVMAPSPGGCGSNVVVVRDLATGTEEDWTLVTSAGSAPPSTTTTAPSTPSWSVLLPTGPGHRTGASAIAPTVGELSWSPGGGSLVVTVGYGAGNSAVELLDVPRPGSAPPSTPTPPARPLGPPGTARGRPNAAWPAATC